jgi:outer membrane lipoprotein SlyB
MNTNMMEMNLNEMAEINGGDTLDKVAGALTGVAVGGMVGCGVGSIAGAPGCVVGMIVGATGCGVAGGIFGITKMKKWLKEHLPSRNR